jgi:hypothetical protein
MDDVNDAEDPGTQDTETPETEDKPFRPVSQMSAREWEQAAREVNRLYPKLNRWP